MDPMGHDPLKDGGGDIFLHFLAPFLGKLPRLATRLAQSNTSAVIMVGWEGGFLLGGGDEAYSLEYPTLGDDWNGNISKESVETQMGRSGFCISCVFFLICL